MRTAIVVSILGCVLLCVCGCKRAESPTKPASSSALAGRLKAAQAITDFSERNNSLSQLAKDAADAGDPALVNESLQGINDFSLRNDTTASAALKLGKAGKGDDAVTVAQTIGDLSVRDRVLIKLSKGDYSE